MAKAKGSSSGTSMVKWDEELAREAAIAAGIEAGVGMGNFIGTAGGILKFRGGEVPGNTMDVVIIDHIIEHALYEGKYDPAAPQPPVCFAFGRMEEGMKAHEKASKPQGDEDGNCVGCPMFEWGTSDVGRGKACKDIRRLALIPEGDLADIAKAEIAYLKIPVTSVKAWAGYVNLLHDTLKRPPFGVITTIKLVPDPKNQFKIVASLKEPISDSKLFEQLIAKKREVEKLIDFPYAQIIEGEEVAQARGNGARKRGAVIKKQRPTLKGARPAKY